MRSAKVLADPFERRQQIRDEVARVAKETGGVPQLDDALLDEIANLTEWPVAIACTFEREFLAVPPEALVTTMETNQKFVPVFDAEGKLTEHFIGIANIESKQPSEIRKGYERVIRPRFADAKFFWDEDLKTPLAGYQDQLKSVTYQQALGSLWDKSVRVAELARIIANRVDVDAGEATRAAALSKCDLLTRMVGEFPELQGVMGRYYADHHGETAEVAKALDSYYQPRFAGDAIAAGKVGQRARRRRSPRHARRHLCRRHQAQRQQGSVRTAPRGAGSGAYPDRRGASNSTCAAVWSKPWSCCRKPPWRPASSPARTARLRRWMPASGARSWSMSCMTSCWSVCAVITPSRVSPANSSKRCWRCTPASLLDFDRRLRAVAEFGRRPEALSLAAANKRVANILRKQAEEAGAPSVGTTVDAAHFEADAERALAAALDDAACGYRCSAAGGRLCGRAHAARPAAGSGGCIL